MKYLYNGKIYDEIQHDWVLSDTGLLGPDGRHAFPVEMHKVKDLLNPRWTPPEYTPTKDIVTTSRELGEQGFNIPIYPNNQYMLIAAFLLDPEMEVPLFATLSV